MRYLGLALFAEGPTDHRFLPPVLLRTVEELCRSAPTEDVMLEDVLELHPPDQWRTADRATTILEAARDAAGGFHILFVHTDGDSDPWAARAPAKDRGAREWRRKELRWLSKR